MALRGDDVGERLVVLHEVVDGVGDRAVRDRRARADPRSSRSGCRAAAGSRARADVPSDGAARGAAGSRRDEPGAEVAATRQDDREPGEQAGRADDDQERPPLSRRRTGASSAPIRSATATRSCRRRCRRSRAARTRRRAPAPPMPYTTRVFSVTCAATERDRGEQQAEQREREAERRPTRSTGRSSADERERHERAGDDVHRRDRDHRGGRQRVRPDGQRAQQLGAARLLLAARQAPEHEDAHQPHQDQPEGPGLERDLTADRVEALRRPVEDDRGRRCPPTPAAALSSSAWFGYRPLTLATVDSHEQHDRRRSRRGCGHGRAAARSG